MSQVCNDSGIMQQTQNWNSDVFDKLVNRTLNEDRISYELVNSQMVEFSSKELHEQVVVPALKLLAGRPNLANVEESYQAALLEISKNESSNAITDAGTAFKKCFRR